MFTKNDFFRIKQCEKKFWLHKNNIEKNDIKIQNWSYEGKEVIEYARNFFENSVKISWENTEIMVETTKKNLFTNKTIFRGVFKYKELIAKCDVLEKKENKYNLYGIKKSSIARENYLEELALQWYVLEKNGIEIDEVNLILINNKYVREEKFEISNFFNIKNVKEKVSEKLENIEEEIDKMKKISFLKKEPIKEIGIYCNSECEYIEYCWKHIPKPSVFELYRMQGKEKFRLYNEGKITFESLKNENSLSTIQKIQIECYLENKEYIDKEELKNFFKNIKKPIYFLDFEAYNCTIPPFKGIRPFQQIPFQYSLHILNEREELLHYEFLSEIMVDEREKIAKTLLELIGEKGSIVAYNMSFEKMIIKDLAYFFPKLEKKLLEFNDRFIDLLEIFEKKKYYCSLMQGKASLKYVLPALFPNNSELDYEKLDIGNGMIAMEKYKELKYLNEEEKQKIKKDLLNYCKLDTYAMVKIYNFLKEKLEN